MLVWNLGVEVKVGQTVTVDPMDPVDSYIHISQVALGEAKKDKPNEPVVLYLKVGEQKIVLGTLSRDGIPHLSLDLVLDSDSELSHTSKSASVFFCGYKVLTYPWYYVLELLVYIGLLFFRDVMLCVWS